MEGYGFNLHASCTWKFLNKKEQVIDFKLTSYGNYLLSQGKFKPEMYAFYDDNVIYDASYVGLTEKQNEIHERIKNNTSYIESLVLFEDVEDQNIPYTSTTGESFAIDMDATAVNPRKDSPASNKIAEPTISAACTMIGGNALGRITRNISFMLDAPEAREAMTYSSSRMRRNSERVIRATAVQLTIPMAKVIIGREAPKSATKTIENSKVGKTWKNSVIRMSTSSTIPR